MPLALLLSALAFYIPRVIWKWLEGGALAHVCRGMAQQDLEEMNYIEEIVGNDVSSTYNIEVDTPSHGQTQTLLGATSDTAQDPARVTKETTMNISFKNSVTLKHVNRLLNFFRVFRKRQRNYATNYLLCQLLNALLAILQVTTYYYQY